MKAHFFNLETLFSIQQECWVVDKTQHKVPIMKISKSDFKLYQSGIFKSQNNKIEFNGKTFWLPTDAINKLKVLAKVARADFGNLAISMREFMDKEIIDSKEITLNLEQILQIKNEESDLYIVCTKQASTIYKDIVNKLREKLKENGILVKNFYFISDTFYNKNLDELNFKKLRLLLQHAVGYKTDGLKFVDEEIPRYNNIFYYDNDFETLNLAREINPLLGELTSRTEAGLVDVVKENLHDYRPTVTFCKINDNKLNSMDKEKICLSLSKIVKQFENVMLFSEFELLERKKSARYKG